MINSNSILKTVDKALQVVLLLAQNSGEMGVREISKKMGINVSTTYRILNTLYINKFVRKNERSHRYGIGLKCLEISSYIIKSLDLRNIAHPFLESLRDRTNETVNLVILDDGMGVYIDRVESSHAVRMVSSIGTREELHCTGVGKALLAFLPENIVDEIIQKHGLPAKTPRTITSPKDLKEHLLEVRKQWYSIDNEEAEEGIICVGAPIFDHRKKVIASISVAAVSYRCSINQAKKNASLVVETAQQISAALGSKII